MGEPILDGHELVVKAALKKVEQHFIGGLKEEILVAMECWPDNEEIQQLCTNILKRYEVDYRKVLSKQMDGAKRRRRDTMIYLGSSQTILQDRSASRAYFDEYLQIIRRYYPAYTEAEAKRVLEHFAEEGCGYAALAATLVQHFSSNPDLFRYFFQDELMRDGQYRTDCVMLDFYCMTDGPNHGMTLQQMVDRYRAYCNFYQQQVDITCLEEINLNTCRQCLEQGYLLLFAGDFTMYFAKYQPSHVKGWHIMNIRDVADDGTITVVSWGKNYTLNLKDIRSNDYFVYVKY